MRIVEVYDRDAVAALRVAWCALQATCPRATPFQTWEWNDAWWRRFGARKRPYVLLFHLRDSEAPVGIAPLYISRHLGTPVRRLAWMGAGVSDYLEPLVQPGFEEQVAQALLSHLQTARRRWDIADLQQLRPEIALLDSARAANGNRHVILPMEPCPYIPLPPKWEEFTARLGKKMRYNVGYYDRLIHKTFADAAITLADASTLEAGMTTLFTLHQQRWNARWLPGVLGNRRVQAFHRDVANRFLERGWLRLHLLYADQQWQAALYCFAYGGRTCYYLGGFSPSFARYSPGTVLTARAIRLAIEEGHAEFDLLRGAETYKYRWLPKERVNHRLLLRSSTAGRGLGELSGRAGFALNQVERYVEKRAKAFAEQRATGKKQESDSQ